MSFIASEYSIIAEGMRLGTLKPAPPDLPPPTWVDKRFANSFMSTAGPGLAPGFGEQFDAALDSSIAYSFGNCSRNDAKKVYVSKEISKGEDLGPGPLGYNIGSSIGPKGTATSVTTRSPLFSFGNDPLDALHRQTGELRELKSSGVDVSTELAAIRARVHRVPS